MTPDYKGSNFSPISVILMWFTVQAENQVAMLVYQGQGHSTAATCMHISHETTQKKINKLYDSHWHLTLPWCSQIPGTKVMLSTENGIYTFGAFSMLIIAWKSIRLALCGTGTWTATLLFSDADISLSQMVLMLVSVTTRTLTWKVFNKPDNLIYNYTQCTIYLNWTELPYYRNITLMSTTLAVSSLQVEKPWLDHWYSLKGFDI